MPSGRDVHAVPFVPVYQVRQLFFRLANTRNAVFRFRENMEIMLPFQVDLDINQLLIESAGHAPLLVPEDRARYSREHVGSDYIGWLHFQPIYEQLAATQPDMFD